MNNNDPTHDELAWQAFRYVGGEMDLGEQEYFESLLVEDQAAREAVASAVELSQATAMALADQPIPVVRHDMGGTSRWAWWAAGVAACVAIVFGVVQLQTTPPPMASAKTEALAARWSEVREQQAMQYPWDDDRDAPSLVTGDWAISSAVLDEQDIQPTAPPEWMLAAVLEQGDSEGALDDMPGDIERGGQESQEQ